jgi:hypothetical protein
MNTYTVEYFTDGKWREYSGPHKNINSAICNASVVSGCRRCNARIKLNGEEFKEGDASYWNEKVKEKAGD